MQKKLLLDTVSLDEIKKYSHLVYGITTNPTFFKRNNINEFEFVDKFRKEYPSKEIHIEAIGSSPESTTQSLEKILKQSWYDSTKVVVKIPFLEENISIISNYNGKGVKFNVHLVYSTQQAYIGSLLNACYICVLVGRYSSIKNNDRRFTKNDSGRLLLQSIRNSLDSNNLNKTKLMASSIRSKFDFESAIVANSDVITIPAKILSESLQEDLSNEHYLKFLEDHQNE